MPPNDLTTAEWYKVVDFKTMGLSQSTDLVCLVSSNAELKICRDQLKDEPCHFLELYVSASEASQVWAHRSRIIEISYGKQEEIPYYLRQHWLQVLRPRLLRHIRGLAPAEKGLKTPGWQILDVHRSPALLTREDCLCEGFETLLSTVLEDQWKYPSIRNGFRKSSIDIAQAFESPDLDLPLLQTLLLRGCFFRCEHSVEITLDRAIKRGKVFLLMRSVPDRQSQEEILVKFDHPLMIQRELENRNSVLRCLKTPQPAGKALSRLYDVERAHYVSGDLLGVIRSKPIDRLENPACLTLLKNLRSNANEIAPVLEAGLRGILRVFSAVAEGSFFSEHDPAAKIEYGTIADYLRKFFRKLSGFTMKLDLSDIREIVDLTAPADGTGALDSDVHCEVRRLAMRSLADQRRDFLEIQLQPKDGLPRLTLSFPADTRSAQWVHRFASRGVFGARDLSLRHESLSRFDAPFPKALQCLAKFPLFRDLEQQLDLTIADVFLPNPFPYISNLYDTMFDGTCDAGVIFKGDKLRAVSSLIHFDLHLENILIRSPGQNGIDEDSFMVIDLASMQQGPLVYDYARLEVAILLDVLTKELKVYPQKEDDVLSALLLVNDFLSDGTGGARKGGRREKKGKAPSLLTTLRNLREYRREHFVEFSSNNQRFLKATLKREDEGTFYDACLFFEFVSELLRRSQLIEEGQMSSGSELLAAFFGSSLTLARLRSLGILKDFRDAQQLVASPKRGPRS